MKNSETKYMNGRFAARLAALAMIAILAVTLLPVNFAFAAIDDEETIREVHKVVVGNKRYCFFVTHNVVMTPKEVASFGDNDEKLTDEVLKRAGLYIKEENCKLEKHKAISPKQWKKMGGTLTLSPVEIYEESEGESSDPAGGDPADGEAAEPAEGDTGSGTTGESASETVKGSLVKVPAIEAIKKAAPTDGDPVRLYMDLVITTETPKDGDTDEPTKYTTFKKKSPNSPKLIYMAVATEKDAALGEEICEDKSSNDAGKDGKIGGKDAGEPKEQLPEERTISMTDRSGGPLEPTLKDGDPVTLEWIEPGRQTDGEKKAGFFDHAWAIPALVVAAVALGAALVLILRKRKNEENEE